MTSEDELYVQQITNDADREKAIARWRTIRKRSEVIAYVLLIVSFIGYTLDLVTKEYTSNCGFIAALGVLNFVAAESCSIKIKIALLANAVHEGKDSEQDATPRINKLMSSLPLSFHSSEHKTPPWPAVGFAKAAMARRRPCEGGHGPP
ncbi:MAG TPA: hypothetical protein PKE55_15300 [Kiritimatiellia bacterium]|nr:hypothetical protein [Kiritimatiellia bacterium]